MRRDRPFHQNQQFSLFCAADIGHCPNLASHCAEKLTLKPFSALK
jgi:hypothetical protein